MSDRAMIQIQKLSTVIGILIGVLSAVQAWAVLPYRIQELESKTRLLETILTRVDKELVAISVSQADIKASLQEVRQSLQKR